MRKFLFSLYFTLLVVAAILMFLGHWVIGFGLVALIVLYEGSQYLLARLMTSRKAVDYLTRPKR